MAPLSLWAPKMTARHPPGTPKRVSKSALTSWVGFDQSLGNIFSAHGSPKMFEIGPRRHAMALFVLGCRRQRA